MQYKILSLIFMLSIGSANASAKSLDDGAKEDALGFNAEYGIDTPVNLEKALQYYKEACDKGGNYGCYNVWYFYQYGIGVAKDGALAEKYKQRLNLNEISMPQKYIAQFSKDLYDKKLIADADKTKRVAYIDKLINILKDRPEGDIRFWKRIGFTQQKVFKLASLWLADGDPEIEYLMGKLYLNDFENRYENTLDKTYQGRNSSLKWFRTAAEKGVTPAQLLMGNIYSGAEDDEWGIKRDIQQAQKWYSLAAEKEDSDAQIELGLIYYSGETDNVDFAKAFTLFEHVEEMGTTTRSTMPLSWMYYNGLGTQTDCSKAWEYYSQAAEYSGLNVKKDEFLSKCKSDKQDRDTMELPNLTVKMNGASIRGETVAPQVCALKFEVSTNKVSETTNLHIVLNLKNSENKSTEQDFIVPPLGLNTLGIDIANHSTDPFVTDIEVPMYSQDFCQYNDTTFTLKSATATINGKEVDLMEKGVLTLER